MYSLVNGQLHCFLLGSVVLKMPMNILVCLLVKMHIYFSWCIPWNGIVGSEGR